MLSTSRDTRRKVSHRAPDIFFEQLTELAEAATNHAAFTQSCLHDDITANEYRQLAVLLTDGARLAMSIGARLEGTP